MRKYIILTSEGFTYQPDSISPEPDIENMQVVGFGQGDTAQEAFRNMLGLNGYPLKTSFNEFFAMSLENSKMGHFSLTSNKKKYGMAG